ncbi:ABC transporter substrate-binding protein [Streptomyces sp. NPDC059524]|uniref:ABC transporter substrate-binding protein n=1 Tax=Streptomyces sp. NPDC059524 TaxID=3346856 RepID=UPI0036C168D4
MARVPLTLGVCTLALGLAATGCTTSGDETGGKDGGKKVKVSIATSSDPTSLDPQLGTVAADFVFARMLDDQLVRRDDKGKIIPGLASRWKADAKSAEFTLRPDAKCTDGTKVTASGVAKVLTRFADPATKSTAASQVFGPGAKVTATGDDATGTVSVKLDKPWSDLLYGLALPQAGIVCPAALDKPELLKSGKKGAGTGAYYIESAEPGARYTLSAVKGYTGWATYKNMPEGTVPDVVEMPVIQSEATMANNLAAGTLDYAAFTGPDVARFVKNDKFTITPAPIVRMMVVFNERKGHPGADAKVREAVARTLDRKAFNRAVTRGSGTLMSSITDASVPCANKDESLLAKPDPAAAKDVLKGMKIKLVGTNAVASGSGNEYVQAALKAAGAEVSLRNADSATWGNDVISNKGDWDLTVLPNLNLTNLLTTPASLFAGPGPADGGRNFPGTHNKDFEQGFGAAMATTDQSAKCAAWDKAQKALLTGFDVVPMATVNLNYTTAARISIAAPDGLLAPETVRVVAP